jgi:hypothetical protein
MSWGNMPGKGLGSIDARAQCIISRSAITIAAPAPILHTIANQVNTHKQQQRTRDDLGEDFIQTLWWNH